MLSILQIDGCNTRGLLRVIENLGLPNRMVESPSDLERADKLVIPSSRSFTRFIAAIRDRGLVGPLIRFIEGKRPVLGISEGMHLLFDVSYEEHQHVGLGVIHGKVAHFDFGDHPAAKHFKAPHQGWNQVHWAVECPLMNGIDSGGYFYFDHVGHAEPLDNRFIAARTNHGLDFASVISRERLFGVEFLPEKSDGLGEQILRNFAAM